MTIVSMSAVFLLEKFHLSWVCILCDSGTPKLIEKPSFGYTIV